MAILLGCRTIYSECRDIAKERLPLRSATLQRHRGYPAFNLAHQLDLCQAAFGQGCCSQYMHIKVLWLAGTLLNQFSTLAFANQM